MSGAGSEADTPRGVRVGRLDSAEAVREELAKLYRGARRKAGALPTPADAARLAFVLAKVSESLLIKELGERVRAIEERQGR